MALLFFTLQATPSFLEIYYIKPMLLAPFAVSIAMTQGEFTGGLFGAFAGILCDYASYTFFGFNAIIFMIACVSIGLLATHLIHGNVINCVILTSAFVLVRALIEYYFFFRLWIDKNSELVLYTEILPTVIYTLILTPIIYFAVRKVSNYFEERLA